MQPFNFGAFEGGQKLRKIDAFRIGRKIDYFFQNIIHDTASQKSDHCVKGKPPKLANFGQPGLTAAPGERVFVQPLPSSLRALPRAYICPGRNHDPIYKF